MSVNKVILIGNVGQVPEVRETDGRRWCKLSLATTDKAYKNRDGVEIPERTEWHNLVFNGPLVSVVETWVNKGMKLYIEGKLRTRKYEKDGQTHYVTEIDVHNMEMLNRPEQDNNNQPI